MNATLHDTNPEPGTLPGYHCHFSSADCVEGEDWLTPADVVGMGLKCTCDDDYNDNVFTAFCYNMRTHQTSCAADIASCGEEFDYHDARYNTDHNVTDDCGDGSPAFGAYIPASCGKQCRCNFEYRSRDATVEAGSTTYGKCYNPDTNIQYCAANVGTCSGSEEYRGPHSTAFTGPECGCDRAHTGACVTVTSPGEFAFENCAVAADSCESGKSFLSATALKTSGLSRDCRLCVNTWDEATVSPAPTDEVTPPPTASPTVSMAPTVSMSPTDTPTTADPTPAPSALSTMDPTTSPTTDPTTAPTTDPTASPIAAPVTPKAACKDNQKYRMNKNKSITCVWIGAKENRRKTQCKKSGVRFNCKITCGTCCSDDLTRTFKVGPKGDKQKVDCSYLLPDSRKESLCPRKVVASACAQSCGRCCKNTPNFTFMDGNTSRVCKDIKKSSKVMKQRFCSDSNVSENCAAACDSCKDFTIKSTPMTKTPVKAPVPAPTPVSAPLDDD